MCRELYTHSLTLSSRPKAWFLLLFSQENKGSETFQGLPRSLRFQGTQSRGRVSQNVGLADPGATRSSRSWLPYWFIRPGQESSPKGCYLLFLCPRAADPEAERSSGGSHTCPHWVAANTSFLGLLFASLDSTVYNKETIFSQLGHVPPGHWLLWEKKKKRKIKGDRPLAHLNLPKVVHFNIFPPLLKYHMANASWNT